MGCAEDPPAPFAVTAARKDCAAVFLGFLYLFYFHKLSVINDSIRSTSQAAFFDNLSQNVTDSFAVGRTQLIAFIQASVCGFLLFHCSIENIRAKAFECEVMLLHGDVLLNEGAELRVGVGDGYRGHIVSYLFIQIVKKLNVKSWFNL